MGPTKEYQSLAELYEQMILLTKPVDSVPYTKALARGLLARMSLLVGQVVADGDSQQVAEDAMVVLLGLTHLLRLMKVYVRHKGFRLIGPTDE